MHHLSRVSCGPIARSYRASQLKARKDGGHMDDERDDDTFDDNHLDTYHSIKSALHRWTIHTPLSLSNSEVKMLKTCVVVIVATSSLVMLYFDTYANTSILLALISFEKQFEIRRASLALREIHNLHHNLRLLKPTNS